MSRSRLVRWSPVRLRFVVGVPHIQRGPVDSHPVQCPGGHDQRRAVGRRDAATQNRPALQFQYIG